MAEFTLERPGCVASYTDVIRGFNYLLDGKIKDPPPYFYLDYLDVYDPGNSYENRESPVENKGEDPRVTAKRYPDQIKRLNACKDYLPLVVVCILDAIAKDEDISVAGFLPVQCRYNIIDPTMLENYLQIRASCNQEIGTKVFLDEEFVEHNDYPHWLYTGLVSAKAYDLANQYLEGPFGAVAPIGSAIFNALPTPDNLQAVVILNENNMPVITDTIRRVGPMTPRLTTRTPIGVIVPFPSEWGLKRDIIPSIASKSFFDMITSQSSGVYAGCRWNNDQLTVGQVAEIARMDIASRSTIFAMAELRRPSGEDQLTSWERLMTRFQR